jgi:uncharacterized protein (TIGR03437 family)
MCQFDTKYRVAIATLLWLTTAAAQDSAVSLEWRPIGTTIVFNGRAGFSGGPVREVAFRADGQALEVDLLDGRTFVTDDFESWKRAAPGIRAARPARTVVNRLPDEGSVAVAPAGARYRAFAAGKYLWRSEDLGQHWVNLTQSASGTLVGESILSLSVSPMDPDRVAIGTEEGVWLSSDGGESWVSLNEGLPVLHLRRLFMAPSGGRGLLAGWQGRTGALTVVEWQPGAKAAWTALEGESAETLVARWTDPKRPALALEARGEGLARSLDGGERWEDFTADLRVKRVTGIAADRAAGVIYVAAETGVFYTSLAFDTGAIPARWTRLEGNLPKAAALDVMLDPGANFLYVSLAGEGVFLTHAPHRSKSPALTSAADFQTRSAAPGAVVAVVGAKLNQATLGGRTVPILSAASEESQVQIPFDATAAARQLEFNDANGASWKLDLELANVAPAIFVDRDGSPLVLDAESGELIDAARPLRAGMRIVILMTGLGKVSPEWPEGKAVPAENPPRVEAPVRVWLNGITLEVLKAELAPGYVGFYAVETRLPAVVDEGAAPLTVEAGGRYSNTILLRVTL